jgi:hypothetical protein
VADLKDVGNDQVVNMASRKGARMLATLRLFAFRLTVFLSVLVAAMPGAAAPVGIYFELITLATAGRYEYRYTLTNLSLATPVSWFSVDFDPALYDEGSLRIASAGLGNWSEQLLASIALLGVPAQYDAYKSSGVPLGAGDSETGFAVEFTWLGFGTPGSQAFTVYDPATLDMLDTGLTTPAGTATVPEPTSMALVLLALCGVAAANRHPRICAAMPDQLDSSAQKGALSGA